MTVNTIPILTYHSIDDSGAVTSTSPAVFAQQMDFLWTNNYRSLPLSAAVNFIEERRPFPEKTFVITFDDGYENVYTDAFPVLQRYEFASTVFLITDYCGKQNDWPGHSPAVTRRSLLSWTQAREMQNYGTEFGAHTVTHPDLTKITLADAEREATRSKEMIQDQLGMKAGLFAYPYGKFNMAIRQMVKNHFEGACSTRLGKAKVNSDLFALSRLDMFYLSNPMFYKALSTMSLDVYLRCRHIMRELKSLVAQPM